MRCFISIDFPVEKKAKKLIEELSGMRGVKCVATLHLTLNFLGEVDDIEPAKKAMDELGSYRRFNAELRGIGAFPNEKNVRVIWLGVKDDGTSASIAEKLCNDLKNCDKPFVPHATLARVKHGGDNCREFIKEHRDETIGVYEVNSIFLKKSTLAPGGPIYENLYEVKLH
ncbi:MAG: RNA 2',3'-cyclic phosphodiesterase [Candidatus Thermoplasmatota archaeon]|nr:RNA 2',3'-cyclic phosphodiesterase [Candidatus Thermoplasmatota archaeon]